VTVDTMYYDSPVAAPNRLSSQTPVPAHSIAQCHADTSQPACKQQTKSRMCLKYVRYRCWDIAVKVYNFFISKGCYLSHSSLPQNLIRQDSH